jgi:Fic family protein
MTYIIGAVPTFDDLPKHLGQVPADVLMLLREVDQAQGREHAFRRQHPERLEALTQVARVQSTEASNAIEGITAPAARIKALVEDKTTPRNRPEEEIAGYRTVLDLIHSARPEAIPFTADVVKQLHSQLYSFAPDRGYGRFKATDNLVEEELLDGGKRVRFTPVPAWRTDEVMRRLHEDYAAVADSRRYHPLLLTGTYVLDFLVIHPFSDGNGRMSRLLTLLLLYKNGYEVGRFVSLEKLVATTRETYYDALEASTTGWHEDEHDIFPWLRFYLGILVAAYREFENRVGALGGRGSKQEAVRQFVRSSISEELTFADVQRACPGVSVDHIRRTLKQLRMEGVLGTPTRGRNATYRRLRTNF